MNIWVICINGIREFLHNSYNFYESLKLCQNKAKQNKAKEWEKGLSLCTEMTELTVLKSTTQVMGTLRSLDDHRVFYLHCRCSIYHCRGGILTFLPKNKTHKTWISSLDCTMSTSWFWYCTIIMSGVTTGGGWMKSIWHLPWIFFWNSL